MGPAHRTMPGVPVVRPRAPLLMEPDRMVPARDLRTRATPVVHRMDLAHRTMQSALAARPRVPLLMEENQGDGAVKTGQSPRKENIVSSPSALGRPPSFSAILILRKQSLLLSFDIWLGVLEKVRVSLPLPTIFKL